MRISPARIARQNLFSARNAPLVFVGASLLALTFWNGLRVQAASFTSTTSGSWGNPVTWGGAGVPGAGDDVTIAAGTTVTLDTTRTSNNLTINAGGTLDLAGQQFSFANNATFTNNGTLTNTAAFNSFLFSGNSTPGGILQSFNGAGTFSGNVQLRLFNNVTVNVGPSTSVTFNSAQNSTNLLIDLGSVLNLANTLTVTAPSSGANYVGIYVGGTISGAGTFKTNGNVSTVSGFTFTSPFEVVSGAQQGFGTFSGAFKIDGGASFKMSDTPLNLNGDLTIQSTATLDFNGQLMNFQGNNTIFANNGSVTAVSHE